MPNNLERNLINNSIEQYDVIDGKEIEELIKIIQNFVENYNYKNSPYKHIVNHFSGNSCTFLIHMLCDVSAIEQTINNAKDFIEEFIKELKENYKENFNKNMKIESKESDLVYVEKLDPNNRHSVIVSRRFFLN